jgi:UDP-N-acetylmuramate dehydrogenase
LQEYVNIKLMSLEIKENEILANHSTFKIGGPARYFTIVKSKEEILEALNFAKEKNLRYFVIGGGSNILFNDNSFDGLVIRNQILGLEIKGSKIIVGSGFFLAQLLNFCVQNNLTGLEWAIGIPGTIGGAIADNTGAFGHSISESILSVSVLDKNGEVKKYDKEKCGFFYRESKFKNNPPAGGNKEIILEAEFEFKQGKNIKEEIKKNIEHRKNRIPTLPSIGCIFKNDKKNSLVAGALIDQCGLRGKTVGRAQISEIQANIIVNLGGATSKDVLQLINICKQKVKEKFNIELEEEAIICYN